MPLSSKVFQKTFVDVTNIHSNIEIQISQVLMLFIVEPIDFNVATFSEDIGYYGVFE